MSETTELSADLLPPVAPLWERICARVFGDYFEIGTEECTIIGNRWRGKIYVRKFRLPKPVRSR